MDDSQLSKLHLCQLDLALELRRICERHNLKYFLTGGTLRGAFERKGFLDGDDDIDIGMPRKDYDVFIKICKEELDEHYVIQNYHEDEHFGFLYSKLRIIGTEFYESNAEDVPIFKGIFIDVYPFDAYPKRKWQQRKQYAIYKTVKIMLLARYGYHFDGKPVLAVKIISAVGKLFRSDWLYSVAEHNLTRYNNQPHMEIAALEGGHKFKERLANADIEDMKTLEFEGFEFCVPNNSKKFLELIYGDKLYLLVKKQGHNIVKLDFGSYNPKGEK